MLSHITLHYVYVTQQTEDYFSEINMKIIALIILLVENFIIMDDIKLVSDMNV